MSGHTPGPWIVAGGEYTAAGISFMRDGQYENHPVKARGLS